MLWVKQSLAKLPSAKMVSFFSVPAKVWAMGVILSLEVRLTFWMGRGNEVGPCILRGS